MSFDDEDSREGERGAGAAEMARRFQIVAAVWLVGAAVLWAVGGLQLGFAIVVGVAGAVSALVFARYWSTQPR